MGLILTKMIRDFGANMSYFEKLELLPNDPIFSLNTMFAVDTRPEKVNLGVGVYADDVGKLTVLESVRLAESHLVNAKLDKNYPPLDGLQDFIQSSLKLIFGDSKGPTHLYGAQTLGGTGALRLGGEFLANNFEGHIFIPQPTWANHHRIFSHAGLRINEYPYYDLKTHSINFSEVCQSIKIMPAGSAMLLHACCQNPSGMDFSKEQWQELSKLLKEQKVIPFFDFAYQGFGTNFEDDAYAVKLFHREGHEMLVAYSFSKNMGLYGERVGLLAITSEKLESISKIASQVKQIIRGIYSMAPLHGARIAATLLASDKLKNQWLEEVSAMQQRVSTMRLALVDGLLKESKNLDFTFLKDQKGLFSYSGLSQEQVLALREQYSIYMTMDGRINAAGLNAGNMDYVIRAISDIVNQ